MATITESMLPKLWDWVHYCFTVLLNVANVPILKQHLIWLCNSAILCSFLYALSNRFATVRLKKWKYFFLCDAKSNLYQQYSLNKDSICNTWYLSVCYLFCLESLGNQDNCVWCCVANKRRLRGEDWGQSDLGIQYQQQNNICHSADLIHFTVNS